MAEKWRNGDQVENPDTGERWVLEAGEWVPVEVTPATAAGINFLDKGVRNILNAPAAAEQSLDALAAGVAAVGDTAVRSGVNLARTGQIGDPLEQVGESFDRFMATEPGQTFIPRFGDMRDIGEDIRTAGLSVMRGTGLEEARKLAQLQADQARNLFPRSSGIGDFAADAATLLAMRRPAAQARSEVAARNAQQAQQFLREFRTTKRQLDPEVQKHLDDTATRAAKKIKSGAQTLTSAGIKIGEAGLEGAFLAGLNNDDPVVSAATMAGVQSAGSLGLLLSTDVRRGLVPFALSAFAAHELWKVFAPGATNFFESEDFAFQAAAAALTVGALGALAGGGRLGPSLIRYPNLGDAATAIPRAVVDNRFREMRDWLTDGDPLMDQVLDRISTDREFFNANQMRSLERAWNSPREDAFGDEIRRLMRDSKDFRERVSLMQQQRTPPAGSEFVPTGRGARELYRGGTIHPIQRN